MSSCVKQLLFLKKHFLYSELKSHVMTMKRKDDSHEFMFEIITVSKNSTLSKLDPFTFYQDCDITTIILQCLVELT